MAARDIHQASLRHVPGTLPQETRSLFEMERARDHAAAPGNKLIEAAPFQSTLVHLLLIAGTTRSVGRFGTAASGDTHAVLGVTAYEKGRVAVYGDSNCLDSSHMRTPCFRLLSKLLTYVATVRIFIVSQKYCRVPTRSVH